MAEQSSVTSTAEIAGKPIAQFGFWVAILTAAVAALSFAIAVAQRLAVIFQRELTGRIERLGRRAHETWQ